MSSTWLTIEEFTPGFECDRCGSTESTKMGQIPISGSFLVMSIRWILCLTCHNAGWRPPQEVQSGTDKIIYSNGRETHTFRLKRRLANPIME